MHSTPSEFSPAGPASPRNLLPFPHLGEAPGLRPRQDPTLPFWSQVVALSSIKTHAFKAPCSLERGARQGGSLDIVILPVFRSLTALCALALPAQYGLTFVKVSPLVHFPMS